MLLNAAKKGWKLSNLGFWGKIVDPCNSLRQRKCVHDRRKNWSLFATFSGWKTLQNQLSDKLMWCLAVRQHDCMASTFLKVNKRSSWKASSVSKEDVVYIRLHFSQSEQQEANITVESPCEWTSTTPVIETSESIEPNDTDLEVKAICFDIFIRLSSKCSKQTFTVPSARLFWRSTVKIKHRGPQASLLCYSFRHLPSGMHLPENVWKDLAKLP